MREPFRPGLQLAAAAAAAAAAAGDVYEPLLRRVPVFQGLEDVCLTRLALKMRLTVTLAGEVLCRCGGCLLRNNGSQVSSSLPDCELHTVKGIASVYAIGSGGQVKGPA